MPHDTASPEPQHATETPALERLNRLYAALVRINQAIVRCGTREELFTSVTRALVDQGGFGMAWVGWPDPATKRLVPVAEAGDQNGYLQSIEVFADDSSLGRGPTGNAFREGKPYICNDVFGDAATIPWRAELERRGFRASAVFPIFAGGVPCATLSVYADRSNFFREHENELLEQAAADLSFALERLAESKARKSAEETASNERRFADNLLEVMPGIFYSYDEQGRFLRWNKNFERLSGYSAEEIAKARPLDFFGSAERDLVGARIDEVFSRGEASVEASFVAKDGSSFPLLFTGKRIMFDGAPHLVGVGVDISARKRAEAALRDLNENLERAVADRTVELTAARERAEVADRIKSAFLANMSHELRTPLNSILGFTGIVLKGMAGPLNAEQTKQLGMVQRSARHLLDLINDVLDLSKIEAGQVQVRRAAFDLAASAERVVAAVSPLAQQKGLALELEIEGPSGPLESDQRRVEQILLNLMNNAIKFTETGSVKLLIDGTEDAPAKGALGPAVRLRVVDTGIGMREQDLPELFVPFRQLDTGLERQHEGTGLGLAICRRLATLLGGSIRVESVWGRGSVFTVLLPKNGAPA